MRNQGQVYFGGFLLLLGILWLVGNLLGINVWALCWPVFLILLGVWIIARPRMVHPGTTVRIIPLADVHRGGSWKVSGEEFWLIVGDVDLDLSHAEIPAGETTIRFFGFVGDVDVILPPGVGAAISSTAFLTTTRVLGEKQESFMGYQWESPGYATAEKRIRLEPTFFVAEVKVRGG